MSERLLKLPEVIKLTGVSKSEIDRKEKAGKFPKRIRLGYRSIAWAENEVNAWIQAVKTARGNE